MMRIRKPATRIPAIVLLCSIPILGAGMKAVDNERDSAQPPGRPEEITNSIGMKLRLIPSGSFMMGASEDDMAAWDSEKPRHKIKISKSFYIGVCEVTQAQWLIIMGYNPSYDRGECLPVENVTWNQAVIFCNKLSELEGVTYRLPTEAEWEYACRAGTSTKYYWGNARAGKFAWLSANSKGEPRKVGTRKPNAWGLYDMSGNIYEWCSDIYDENYYSKSPRKDPQGPSKGKFRVLRGGSYIFGVNFLRSSCRIGGKPSNKLNGFRVVRDAYK